MSLYINFMKANCLYFKENKTEYLERDFQPKADEVLVEVHYSGVNYKDALGVCNRAPIFKKPEIIPGIDLAGKVLESRDSELQEGSEVLVNGMGLGESIDGGYSGLACVPRDKIVPLPAGLSLKESMALGTAGFTAGLAVQRMVTNGQTPEKGPILISGATGGVGAFALQIFNKLGFETQVVTHRPEKEEYLKNLGAQEVLFYEEHFSGSFRPLEKGRWGGVVDNLGGEFLERVLPQIHLWGNVASIGLAKGASFKATVMPFILRGVSLLGASSNNCDHTTRLEVWDKLGSDWKPGVLLDLISQELSLDQVVAYSQELLDHKRTGRALVKIKGD